MGHLSGRYGVYMGSLVEQQVGKTRPDPQKIHSFYLAHKLMKIGEPKKSFAYW